MRQIRLVILFLALVTITACSTSPIESTIENTNKIPPAFTGTWELVRISCAGGAPGPIAEFINGNLNTDKNGTKLGLVINQVQDEDVVLSVSNGIGKGAAICTYIVNQHWKKTGHWLQVSSPSHIKSGDSTSEACETVKADFITSPVFRYILPAGELSIERKNERMYLFRTLGRAENDLEVCQASDRFIYELKKQSN